MVIGRRTTGGIPGLPDPGISSHSASRRPLTTGSTIAITGEALLTASAKSETAVLARVETSMGRNATKPVDSIKASHAMLGGVKPRIRTVETATGSAKRPVVKATAKKAVLQTDSEAANGGSTNSFLIQGEPAAQAIGLSSIKNLQVN